MYGQDLYFVTAVWFIGMIFVVGALILERIFDRWSHITIPTLDTMIWPMTIVLTSTMKYNAGRSRKPVKDVVTVLNYSHSITSVTIVLLNLKMDGTSKSVVYTTLTFDPIPVILLVWKKIVDLPTLFVTSLDTSYPFYTVGIRKNNDLWNWPFWSSPWF